MKIEEIILHFLVFTVLVVIGILTIQVWHYLNSKPLGLQTILDDLAKESFTVFGLALVLNWTTRINPGLEFNFYTFTSFIIAKLVRNLCSYMLILFALSMIIVSNDNLYAHVKRNFKASISNQASSSGLNQGQEDLHINELQQPNEESQITIGHALGIHS